MKPALQIALLAFSSVVHAASFDCSKASSFVEHAICTESQLSQLDDRLSRSYNNALAATRDPDALRFEQRTWLAESRNTCVDVGCLTRAYNERLAILEAKPDTSARPTTGASRKQTARDSAETKNEASFFGKLAAMIGSVISGIAQFFLVCGAIVCIAGLAMMPKGDKRFTTGYKENAVPTWQTPAAIGGGLAAGASALLIKLFG